MSEDQPQAAGGEKSRRTFQTAGSRKIEGLEEQVALLHRRITDEVRGSEERLRMSLAADVERLEDLIRATNERIDDYMGSLAVVNTMIAELDVRLQEVAELREQPRSAERLEARRLAALEDAIARLGAAGGSDQS